MSRTRDYQKRNVYKWENEVVGPRCHGRVRFENAQAFVDGIWLAEGLLYPPRVELAHENSKHWSGSRTNLELTKITPAWVIIHELAHTLTMSLEDSDGHGPDYVGNYIRLLDKYMGVPLALSLYTLDLAKIKVNIWAKPVFLDKPK